MYVVSLEVNTRMSCSLGSISVCRFTHGSSYPTSRRGWLFQEPGTVRSAEILRPKVCAKLCFRVYLRVPKVVPGKEKSIDSCAGLDSLQLHT